MKKVNLNSGGRASEGRESLPRQTSKTGSAVVADVMHEENDHPSIKIRDECEEEDRSV